ncbi:MAG: serine/threonine-protein kinase [Planctomycetaceae bacterium]
MPADESVRPSAELNDPAQTSQLDSANEKTKTLKPITDLKDRQLGEFRLLRRLGHGGMAEVYLAEQTTLNRKVAVKVLREEMLSDEVNLRRFEQEAQAAGGLNHPNIVQVFMIGEQDGIHYIAQEYVSGMNLREYITRNGPPQLSEAIKIMRQIASALEAASEAGIVHRDVKPENILLTNKGDVKVADFGLAQLSLSGEKSNLTQVGMTMGTPLYMSPEQVNGRQVDHRSDIYSLGVTCYHLLGGNPPFRGETAFSVAVQHINTEPPPLQEQRPDLPKVVCRLIHKMMSKQPDDRYQTAAAIEVDLQKIAEAIEKGPQALARLRLAKTDSVPAEWNWFERIAHWSWKQQSLAVLAVFLVVIGISALVGYFQRPENPFEAPVVKSAKAVPKKESAFAQYLYASELLNDEDAWKAVSQYFPEPENRSYRNNAQLGLAMLYLRSQRFAEAEAIFKEFTIVDDKDETLKATGYAGLAVSAAFQGDEDRSRRIIADDLAPYREKLNDRELQRLIDEIRQRNQRGGTSG